jgi:hypothetical protein
VHAAVPSFEADFALNLLRPLTEEGKMLVEEGSSLCSAKLGFAEADADSDTLHRVCQGLPTVSTADIEYARRIHAQGKWVLNWKLRSTLYSMLFIPMVPSELWITWNRDVVKSNIRLLKQLQGFMLRATTILSTSSELYRAHERRMTPPEFANLEFFVVDAVHLLEILRTPNPPVPYDETHPLFRLNQLRFDSWSLRCQNCLKCLDNHYLFIDWQDYMCALCDALFGIWPTEVNEINIFHTTTDKPVVSTQMGFHRECIRCILSFYNSTASSSSIKSIDYHVFDASYIETCGPFRFKATKSLARHLTINA